ncbi:MAG: hypothetical protein PVG95_12055, partial [Methyloceanibacter sp.]
RQQKPSFVSVLIARNSANKRTLIWPELFPAHREQFPVPGSREMATYALIYMRKIANRLTFCARIGKFPSIFPLNREWASETGSQMTAPTAMN